VAKLLPSSNTSTPSGFANSADVPRMDAGGLTGLSAFGSCGLPRTIDDMPPNAGSGRSAVAASSPLTYQ